jgi:5,10-methylenetetrahydrofolate reductase
MSSVNFYDTSARAEESTRAVAEWLREEKLEQILPHPPKITGGKVIVEEMKVGA